MVMENVKVSFNYEGPISLLPMLTEAVIKSHDGAEEIGDDYKVFSLTAYGAARFMDQGRKMRPLAKDLLRLLVKKSGGGLVKDYEIMKDLRITKDQLTAIKSGITRRCGSIIPHSYLIDTTWNEQGDPYTYLGSSGDHRSTSKYEVHIENLIVLREYFENNKSSEIFDITQTIKT